MNNQSFSKIWILITLIIFIAGGILAWQYFGVLKEEVKIPEAKAPEEVTKYPRSVEFFATCAKSYSEYPEGITEEEFREKLLTPEEKEKLTEEEKKRMYEEFLEEEKIYEEFFKISDNDIETIFGQTIGLKINDVDVELKPEDFEKSLSKGTIGEKEVLFLGGLYGWGDITPLCRNNLMDENLRPQKYNDACKANPICCALPEPEDINSAKNLVEKFFECMESPIKVDFEKMEKLKYGYFVGGGWGHVEAVYIPYYLTDTGCLLNCYTPYMHIVGIKKPLIEEKMRELEFERLPEEIKTKVKEFENKIESLYEKAISEKNAEICGEIKREVEKVEVVSKEKDRGKWEVEAMIRKSAYRYENEYYEPCIKIIAVKLNDESLCDKMPSPKFCQKDLFLQYTDLCSEISVDFVAKAEYCKEMGWGITEEKKRLCVKAIEGIRAKEDCIKKVALETGNIELCKKILDKDCQNELAIKLNKPEECVGSSCIEELAIRNNDAELCKKITNESGRGSCMKKIAFNTDNVDLCGKISDRYERGNCYLFFGKKFGQKGDIKLCERFFHEEVAYRACRKEVAVQTGNVELCGEDKNCIKQFAIRTKNPEICKLLPPDFWQDKCYDELGIKLPYLGVPYALIDKELQKQFNLPVDYGALIPEIPEGYEGTVIIPGSPADKAGIKERDIILEVNGERITKENDLRDVIRKYKIGDEIVLKILRQGKEIEIKVVLDEKS